MTMTTMPTTLWTYRARSVRAVDGDTVILYIDAGFHNYREERVRLQRVNCPELIGPDHEAGLAAKKFTEAWLTIPESEWPLTIVTQKTDLYGRYLAEVYRTADGDNLGDALLRARHAVPYPKAKLVAGEGL